MQRYWLIVVIGVVVSTTQASATVINVPGDCPTIQAGIDSSSDGDTVLVQSGTYVENVDFNGHNITLGSLFLTTGDTSYIDSTIIDGNESGPVVSFNSNEDSTAILTGFTVQNAFSYQGAIRCVGTNPIVSRCVIDSNDCGVKCYDASPLVLYCIIVNNLSGILCVHSDPIIDDCLISGSEESGIYCQESSPSISNCIISNNCANRGAGIVCNLYSNSTITNCLIRSNVGIESWGGIACGGSSNPLISHCILVGNSDTYGGGGINCCETSNPIIEYCDISNNCGLRAGGIIIWGSSPLVRHCTITGNTSYHALGGGGIIVWASNHPIIANTIVANNSGNGGIRFQNFSSPFAVMAYCDVYNNEGGNFSGEVPGSLGELVTVNSNGDSCDVYRNIFMDPMFVDTANGDYHLMAGSPCIDAGDPESPLDPDSTIADMGAFYYDQSSWVYPKDRLAVPREFRLLQNYPNPFNPQTVIPFEMAASGKVKISIYNVLGQEVATVANGVMSQGFHRVTWDAGDYPSGIYFYRMQVENMVTHRKMILLK